MIRWDSLKVRHETYEKIVELKGRIESRTKRTVSIADIVDSAITELIRHDDEGQLKWKSKLN